MAPAEVSGPPILVTGGKGTLGNAFQRVCQARGLPCRLVNRAEVDIANESSVQAALETIRPWAVINAAGYVHIDEAERNAERCWRENVAGPTILATACRKAGLPLITFSSDLVFDGQQRTPYGESDQVNPLGVYGRAKAECESRVLDTYPEAMVVRTSAFFSPWSLDNFMAVCRRSLLKREPCLIHDGVISPTYLPDLVHACLDLVIDRAAGVWHLAGQGEISWAELVDELAQRAGLAHGDIIVSRQRGESFAPRPPYSALRSERGAGLPSWRNALDRYYAESATLFASFALES